MKHLGTLGLAAVAVTALLALAATGLASAETTLCFETKDPCPAGKGYGVGQEIHAVSIETPEVATEGGTKHAARSGPTLTSGLGSITCENTFKGTVATATTPSITGELTWANCTGGTTTTTTNGNLKVYHDTEHNGTVTIEGLVWKITQGGVPCYYSSEGIDGTLTGGSPAIIHITATVPKIDTPTHDSSQFCPANGQTHATFEVTTPKPLYVTTAGSTLCKATEDPCGEGNGYGVGEELHAVSSETPEVVTAGGTKHAAHSGPTLTGGLGTIICDSTFNGTVETASTPSVSGEWTWTTCSGGTSTTATNGSITIHHDTEHNGTVTIEGLVRKITQAGIPCYYSSEGVDGTLTGGNPAIIHITATVPKIDTPTHDSSAFCPANEQTHATYEVTTPKPLYVMTGV